MPTRFVPRNKRHATVCRDVPPPSYRKHKGAHIPSSAFMEKVTVTLPYEYADVLRAMFSEDSLSIAIRKYIVLNVSLLKGDPTDDKDQTTVHSDME